jgi:hypothetical protein
MTNTEFDALTDHAIANALRRARPDSDIRALADAAGWQGLTPPPHPDGHPWDATRRNWILPPPPPEPPRVPASIPTHQFRGQLILDGHDPNAIRAMLDQETNPTARLLNLNEWDTGQVVYRDHALVTAIGPLLGYDTTEKLDDFFRRASKFVHPGVPQ